MYAVLNRRTLLPVMLRNGGENSQMGGMTRFCVCMFYNDEIVRVFILYVCSRCIYITLILSYVCLYVVDV